VHSFIKNSLLTILLASSLLTQGCAISQGENNNTGTALINHLVIAEPLAINFKRDRYCAFD